MWVLIGQWKWKLFSGLLLSFFILICLDQVTQVQPNLFYPKSFRGFLDRNGDILRWIPDEKGERYIWNSIESFPPLLLKAFIAAEDKRFYRHGGIDPAAILRAIKDNIINGRIVSGASTITQQLVRMVYPTNRTFIQKSFEAIRAIRVEGHFDKDQILEFYLNRVPLGNNLLGIKAASKIYFGKSSGNLTLSEMAILASLPKAPGSLNPYGHHVNRLMDRKNWVLGQMFQLEFISLEDKIRAQKAVPKFLPREFPFKAPHFVDLLLKDIKPDRAVFTTIDSALQKRIEQILISHQPRLMKRSGRQASAVVLDNATSQVLAMSGSFEYSTKNHGYNNGAVALRSPGSTLKPFVYAQALDSGFNAASILEDVRRSYSAPQGVFTPANFNRRAYGPVSMREALGNSLNQSAIFLLSRVRYDTFYDTLASLGLINYPEHGPNYYGLGLVVGNPEVSLLELVAAYSALSNGGIYRPPQLLVQDVKPPESQVFSPEASFIVTDILSDPGARVLTFGDFFNQKLPFKMAIKTGTSTHYRDAWIIGYTQKYTVGIWVGNFNGRPTNRLSGASAGGAILGEMMNVLHPNRAPGNFDIPQDVGKVPVCSISGMKPLKTCPHIKHEYFISGNEPKKLCTFHAKDGQLHNLPTPFASWLHGKYQRGSMGRFRLAGFDPKREKIFDNNSNTKSIIGKILGFKGRHFRSKTGGEVRITSPVNWDEYLLTHDQGNYEITLESRVNKPFPKITWYIDGTEYAKVGPPYEVTWKLKKGMHEIMAVDPFGKGDSVTILVD